MTPSVNKPIFIQMMKKGCSLHCDIIRQKGVEKVIRLYSNWSPIKTLSEEFKPQFSCLIP